MLTPLLDPHTDHHPAHEVTLHWLAFWTDPEAIPKMLRADGIHGPCWHVAVYGAEIAVATGIAGRIIGVKVPYDVVADIGPRMICHLEVIRDNMRGDNAKRLLEDSISWIRRTYL